MPRVGDLMQTTRGVWMSHPPTHCPEGHRLGGGQVLVGHVACAGHGGGHTTWMCRARGPTVHAPAHNPHRTVIDGPAAVRIGNRK